MRRDTPPGRLWRSVCRSVVVSGLRRIIAGFMMVYFLVLSAQAQEDTPAAPGEDVPASIQGGLGLLIGFPVGQFGDNVTNPGIGIGGHIGYRFPKSLAILGLDVGYLIYGRERRRERFSTTIPDVTVDVITDNNILLTNLFLRLQPREGVFRPYIDGLIGFHYLFTETSIRDIPEPFGDEIASSINFDDVAFTYGGAAGFMIEVYDGREKRTRYSRGIRTASLDFRIRYLDGAHAEYLKRGDVVRQDGQVRYNITSSETNLVTAFIGVAIEF
jgi:hypothetical protein